LYLFKKTREYAACIAPFIDARVAAVDYSRRSSAKVLQPAHYAVRSHAPELLVERFTQSGRQTPLPINLVKMDKVSLAGLSEIARISFSKADDNLAMCDVKTAR
jgi:hypothetical protein